MSSSSSSMLFVTCTNECRLRMAGLENVRSQCEQDHDLKQRIKSESARVIRVRGLGEGGAESRKSHVIFLLPKK